jgi:hypothetical protein
MLTYHDEFGTLLEHCGGSRHLPSSLATLTLGPEPSNSGRDRISQVEEVPPKLRLSPAEMSAQEDATGLPLKNVRHTYKARAPVFLLLAQPSIACHGWQR